MSEDAINFVHNLFVAQKFQAINEVSGASLVTACAQVTELMEISANNVIST